MIELPAIIVCCFWSIYAPKPAGSRRKVPRCHVSKLFQPLAGKVLCIRIWCRSIREEEQCPCSATQWSVPQQKLWSQPVPNKSSLAEESLSYRCRTCPREGHATCLAQRKTTFNLIIYFSLSRIRTTWIFFSLYEREKIITAWCVEESRAEFPKLHAAVPKCCSLKWRGRGPVHNVCKTPTMIEISLMHTKLRKKQLF